MVPMPLVMLIIWIGIPLLIAAFISSAVRTPEYTRRIAWVVYSIAFCLWAIFPFSGVFKLGIDLSGGTILLYQVKQPAPSDFKLDKMVSAIQRRVNPIGLTDVTIRGVGTDRVEIIIPKGGKEEVDRCKRILTDLGTLEFRILANQRDHGAVVREGEKTFPNPVLQDGKVIARWVPVAPDSRGSFVDNYGGVSVRNDEKLGRLVLVMQDAFNVTGEFLRQASAAHDDLLAPAVSFRFNGEGAARFATLTGQNRPDADGFQRRLAIILNGEVHSAPSLREQIHDQGIITGRFTQQEVDDLVTVLNTGSLPGELEHDPISQLTVGPSLGRDTIESGLWAIGIASAVVFLFMLAYYRVAGFIADLAVILNVALVVAVMVWLKASFTLAGLAGLALTIGMSVDANVLIFERLREEQQAGKSLRVAIRSAFERAMRPILDSNITTLLTGFMLYTIGSEQVRGFALTLILGLIANLFTAVFVCRLVFDILERNGWKRQFGMLRLLDRPHWNFMRLRFAAVGMSLVLTVVGMTSVLGRGRDLFDIDFTGGTLAAVRLKQPVDSATVRELTGTALPDVSVEELHLRDEPAGQHYLVRTTLADQGEVRRRLGESLGDYVVRPTMTVAEFKPIAGATERQPVQGDESSAEKPVGSVAPPVGTAQEIAQDADAQPTAGEEARKVLQTRSFAGGHGTTLTFDAPVTLSSLRTIIDEQLLKQTVIDPQQHYSLTGETAAPHVGDGFVTVSLATDLEVAKVRTALAEVGAQLAAQPVLERLDNFGSQVAGEARGTAALALLAGMAVIVVYLWVRFQNVLFGLGAVIALLHDVLIVLGLIGLSRWLAGNVVGDALLLDSFKIDLPMVAAFLTLIGYSVNDTIVVFDRIRELRKRHEPISWSLLNNSINQTLSRTLLTSLTTWIVAVILYGVGGQGLHGFSFVLVAGVVVGTYSSIYIASPVLMWLSGQGATKQASTPSAESTERPAGQDESKGDPVLVASPKRIAHDGNTHGKNHRKGRRRP